MSGLFRRLSSRRSAGPDGDEPQTAAQPGTSDAPATTPAEPEGHRSLLSDPAAETRVQPASGQEPAPEERPTEHLPGAGDEVARAAEATPAVDPTPAPHVAEPTPAVGAAPLGPSPYVPAGEPGPMPVADLPAGLDPDELNAVPGTSARRGKLRRRIAFLRAAREVLLRDLGGFVYELHRTAGDIEHEAHRRLRETKLTRLSRVDAELHELEYRLDDVRRQVIVREPGVGGECPHCGELFGSAAHYCSQCGLPLTESARREQARAREPEPLPDPVVAPAPEAAALTDQPTQEIPPLDPDHPGAGSEFEWPRREGASWTAEPSGLDTPPSDDVTGEPADTTASEPDPNESDTTPSAETAQPAGDETPSGEAVPPADAPAADDDTLAPASDEPAPPSDATAGDDDATPSDAVAPPSDATSGDAATDDAAPPSDETAAQDASAGGDAQPTDEPQQNGSVLSPVERRP